MKPIFYIFTLLAIVSLSILTSCGKDFQGDIDRLNEQHEGIEQRVTSLEAQVAKTNTQLTQLSSLSAAVEQGFYITAVKATTDGYELTISDGHTIALQDGPDNRLSFAPAISMTQISGFYYWSMNGVLLTDANGNPIRTTGLTPLVQYDNTTDQWLISIDGGATFQDVNTLVSVVINDSVLLEVINNYIRQNGVTLFNQQTLYQIISTYIQRNYAELFNVELLDQVVTNYINKNYTRLFNYELLEKIFTQYNFTYYTSQIEVEKLVNLIVTFIQENKEIFTDNDVLYEIISNYIEVNKTTLFTSSMLLEVVNDFIANHANFINIDLLTQVVCDYIDQHRDTVFNTDIVRQMMMEYIRKYYVQVFSQDILVQALNFYVSQNENIIFNETLISEILDTYVQNNYTNIFTTDILNRIVNTYVEQNASTLLNSDVLVEVLANYFQANYNLFIDHTIFQQLINDYVDLHHDTIISVDIVEKIIGNYLREYYTEVFSYDMMTQIVRNYFETNKTVLYEYLERNVGAIRNVSVVDDQCIITLSNGQNVCLYIYDAYARLGERVQSLVVMPGSNGYVNAVIDETNPDGEFTVNYMVTPTYMAEVIASKSNTNEMTLNMLLANDNGDITQIKVSDISAQSSGIITLKARLPITQVSSIDEMKWTVALHIKENKIGGTDIMTEFAVVKVSEFDQRITQEIPEEYLKRIRPYMPIYSGNTPPNIEGTYIISKNMLVFDSTGGYSSGATGFLDYVTDFYGQDMLKNIVLFREEERNANKVYSSSDWAEAKVLGRNENFTAFIIVDSKQNDGYTTAKMATILSGTMTSSGISDFYFGFVLLDKYDPDNTIIPVGGFRIFKDQDGWSEQTSWWVRQMISSEVKGMNVDNLKSCISIAR